MLIIEKRECLENTRYEFEVYKDLYWQLLERECVNCGEEENLQLHHIVPLSLGGTNYYKNICGICEDCHSKIHDNNGLRNQSMMIRKGKEKNRRKGRWTGGRVSYGYKKGEKKSTVIINEEESEIVRMIFKMRYETKYSVTQIIKILNYMAIPTREKGEWSPAVLERMFKKDIFFGNTYKGVKFEAILDKKMQEKVEEFKRIHTKKFKSKWIVYSQG